MDLITDPKVVEVLAKQNERHTLDFFRFLKVNKRSKEIDAVVHQLNDSVTSKIDCTQCGNCCKTMNAAMTQKEMTVLASCISLSPQKFKEDYLEHDEIENAYFIKTPPCVFLKDNKCMVYQQRPASCAEYPHLNKPNFIFRAYSVHANYECCPIVFNVVEKLKQHYHFR